MCFKKNLKFAFVFCLAFCSGRELKIAFYLSGLSFQGGALAIYNYAHFNEKLLGNKSFIMNFDLKRKNEVRERFKERFGDAFYDCDSLKSLDEILKDNKVDIFHIKKSGHYDGILSKVCKNVVHIVFDANPKPHGDVYASLSPWLTRRLARKGINCPCVPRMIVLPEVEGSLRKELNIPDNAIVFGRYGGYDSFDIPFVKEVVKKVAETYKNIYFLFMNTRVFSNLKNIIYLSPSVNLIKKVKFINTCDAMLHARERGETFGQACAEFSIKNKPVITWGRSPEKNHIDILKDKGIYYTNKKDLEKILIKFDKSQNINKKWDAYSQDFNPEVVMKNFDKIFIKPFFV